ncbi:PREDICTED: serine-rich adhesin for platelets-like isoform X1 [Dinoponera quadriceps]|uniref:protein kinase C n=1 Tax=Dinoponera quadriceps TaxID=609295 RepID=A0A6P3XDY4_DINQU|nr:PREDICTED: serine-rich adhesin for platelets-like isoform X1 [Dinoponera quadriceps]
MPYYNDVPYYYGGSYANHSSLMTGTGRPFVPLSRFSPHLSTISESPLSHLHRFAPISARHPRRVIDTADIDVSTPRILSHDGGRPRNRLRRDRPTIKIRSQALKDNPVLREHHERHEKSVGELLMEKFLIKDIKKISSDEEQPVRLYHQASLESDESGEALQKRVTRRFTRRRSSTDLDQEQLQREATYAQVQAKMLDSLVAEEQAQIESEARRGTLVRKGTVRGPGVNGHSYYSNNSADSDAMTRVEEEAAAQRARKAAKKAKRKKKPSDKPSPPDNRRSSTSSEVSTDSKNEEELEENGPRPQMYKIEACNSVGDFSTIWMNASENERKLGVEQFRESVRVPIPRKAGGPDAKNTDEAETRIVLPVRKPYVKDSSRNSVYLTMKKPPEKFHDERLDEKLDEKLGAELGMERLANGFVDAPTNLVPEDDVVKSSMRHEEPAKLNGEARPADDVEDAAFKRSAGKLKSSEEPPAKKRDATPKSLVNDVKRNNVISKTKDDEAREADAKSESLKSTGMMNASSSSVEPATSTSISTQTRSKSESSKDALDAKTKKDNESRKSEDATGTAKKKNLEAIAAVRTKTPQAVASSKDTLDVNLKKEKENRKNEDATDATKKNLKAIPTTEAVEALVCSQDSLSANVKKDNENREDEDAVDVTKRNLGAIPATKTEAEALVSSKDSLFAIIKRDNETRKDENATGVTKKNLKAITRTKTVEALVSPQDSLSVNMKRDNETRKDENAIGVTKKNVEPVTTIKTAEAVVSPQDSLSTTRDNENLPIATATKKNLERASAAKTKTSEVLVSAKDILSGTVRKDEENRKDEIPSGATKRKLEASAKTPETVAASRMDKLAQEEEARGASDAPKVPATSHEDVTTTTTRRSVPTNAGDTRENSASIATLMPTPNTSGLPKASKINADRNNAVEAPELSLRRESAAYLASRSPAYKSERRVAAEEDAPVNALPGKNKASDLARRNGRPDAPPKTAIGVDEAAARGDDAADSKSTTLPANGEVRSNETGKAGDVKPTRDGGLTGTPRYKSGAASPETISSPAPPARSEAEATKDATPLKIDVKKVSAANVAKDSSRDSGVSSAKAGKASKLGGAESRFPFKVKTLQKASEASNDSSAGNDDGKAPKILKKSTSVIADSTGDPSNANLPGRALRQCASVDEKAAGKSMPVKKPVEKPPSKFPSKVPEKKKPAIECAKPSGQLSKSASTESIDFWSEIKASDSPRASRSKQSVGIERKADPISGPKRVSGDSPARGKPAIKELEGKKNEGDVKISVAPGATAAVGDADEERKAGEKAAEKSAQQTKAPRVKKKTGNLSIAIGAKEPSSTVKKARPAKREDSSPADSDATPTQSDSSSTVSTPLAVPDMPAISVEVPKDPNVEVVPDGQNVEEHDDVSTPTNELPDPTKISKWSNQDDLTNTDDAETPVASEKASLAASPAVSPQSSRTKRAAKKKKPSGKKSSAKPADKETSKLAGNEVGQQNPPTAKPLLSNKLLLAKPSPKGSPMCSPRNSPSQRPLDLIKMFYTTPSALLTATPRDLSKVRRAKIGKQRRRLHSRTPSVSSDSTGSTTSSTATTESTDGSGSTCTELDDDAEHKRMNSTRSNDSGFDGSPRISTPSQSSDNQRNSDSSDHFSSGRITPPATNLPRFKKYAVTDFNFLKVLGKGSFGKVLLAELRGTECVYAVKCLKKDVVLEDDDVECTLIERKVLTLATRHPYLCHLFCTFQTESHLFFVMEYLNGGDLMFHIQKSGRFPEARARFYAAEIWSGLNFLHKKGIVYRDLKLDNVLLDFDGHIRIADFGMCKLQIFLDRTADTFCGTPDYMAPEIIKGLKYNQAVDWWSYGVLLYEMLTGQSPFSGCDEDELFWSICNERPFIPRYLSQEATDILVCLLEKDSGKRPPGHEIAMHAFFQHLPWDRLERRQLEAPFKPALEHTLDTRYFDTAFTTERPRLTPVPEQILTSMDQGVFRGFSYTNPNATD